MTLIWYSLFLQQLNYIIFPQELSHSLHLWSWVPIFFLLSSFIGFLGSLYLFLLLFIFVGFQYYRLFDFSSFFFCLLIALSFAPSFGVRARLVTLFILCFCFFARLPCLLVALLVLFCFGSLLSVELSLIWAFRALDLDLDLDCCVTGWMLLHYYFTCHWIGNYFSW